MTLDDLTEAVEAANADLRASESAVELDGESRTELAMLAAALDADPDELVRRAVHLLFDSTTSSGKLDFHLRSRFDVTYEEYLSGMSYDEMTGANQFPPRDDERPYQF